jgi:hypothetical protein
LVGSGQSPQKAINIDKGQMGWLHVSYVMAQPPCGSDRITHRESQGKFRMVAPHHPADRAGMMVNPFEGQLPLPPVAVILSKRQAVDGR